MLTVIVKCRLSVQLDQEYNHSVVVALITVCAGTSIPPPPEQFYIGLDLKQEVYRQNMS
jgi:hypothetical protein